MSQANPPRVLELRSRAITVVKYVKPVRNKANKDAQVRKKKGKSRKDKNAKDKSTKDKTNINARANAELTDARIKKKTKRPRDKKRFQKKIQSALGNVSNAAELLENSTLTLRDTAHKKERSRAIANATNDWNSHSAERLVLWTDGSVYAHSGRAGGAVILRKEPPKTRWMSIAFALNVKTSTEAELFAIAVAMHCAYRMICRRGSRTAVTEVVIYSDCRKSVMEIEAGRLAQNAWQTRTPAFNRKMSRLIAKRSAAIKQAGATLELRWVPGHNGVPGNVEADTAAKRAARLSGDGLIPAGCLAKIVERQGQNGLKSGLGSVA